MASTPSEQDLQELLRLLTTTRKLSILQAMTQVKALQAANLRSIQQIAEAALSDVQAAVKEAAAARSLQNSCKRALKTKAASKSTPAAAGGGSHGAEKRPALADDSAAAKRVKPTAPADPFLLGSLPVTPAELERSLALPVAVPGDGDDDGDGAIEERMAATVLQTNRAPLVLAFAVELLRYTMPEQPLSSRLSLAQAVVSANSRTRARTLGMAGSHGPDDEEDWGQGQPRVRILGREVAVLKRGGYTWRGEETEAEAEGGDHKTEAVPTELPASEGEHSAVPTELPASEGEHSADSDLASASAPAPTAVPTSTTGPPPALAPARPPGVWSVSQAISLKGSTFVARVTTMTDPAQRPALLQALMQALPGLQTADHNVWAYRVRTGRGHDPIVRQDAYDDGETGGGDFVLRVLQELGGHNSDNGVNVLVLMTRWYGGVMLGPDRWRLMRNCVTGAMAERLRRAGGSGAAAVASLGGEAVWGLDLGAREGTSSGAPHATNVIGMPIHRPEGARQYLLKSFATAEERGDGNDGSLASPPNSKRPKKKTARAMDAEKADNLGLLLGALRLLYDSWADHLSAAELDRRAWGWYVTVRPDVDAGPAGWGAKGPVRLKDILALRRAA